MRRGCTHHRVVGVLCAEGCTTLGEEDYAQRGVPPLGPKEEDYAQRCTSLYTHHGMYPGIPPCIYTTVYTPGYTILPTTLTDVHR